MNDRREPSNDPKYRQGGSFSVKPPWFFYHWCLQCESGPPCWHCWLNRLRGKRTV